ncbi:MAG: hypothetical protein CVU04_03990 [Bacteroidetes bacterium HGW-Bacteroidetes-20]|nr:MAG: hypothetical protein CVU04_03990 [Bacteroidetes bacterium HGW-Bacteroidetes-20]
METIQPGASFAQIIEKINELVQYVNTREQTSISYNELENKPRIDNIELTESTEMKDLRIDLAQFPNLTQLEDLVSSVAGNMATQTAETVAAQKVQTELAVENALKTGYQPQDNMQVLIYAQNEIGEKVRYYISFAEFAEYTMNYINSKNDIVVGIPS